MDISGVVESTNNSEIIDVNTIIDRMNRFLLDMNEKKEDGIKPYEFFSLDLKKKYDEGRDLYISALKVLKTVPAILEYDDIFNKKVETLALCLFALKDLQFYQETLRTDKDNLTKATRKELKTCSRYWSEVLTSFNKSGVLGHLLPASCVYYSYLKVSAEEYIQRAHNEMRNMKSRVKTEKTSFWSKLAQAFPSAVFYAVGLFVFVELIIMCLPFLSSYPPYVSIIVASIPVFIQIFIFLSFPLKAIKNGNKYWVFCLFVLILFGAYYGHAYLVNITELPPVIHNILHAINNWGPFTSIHFKGLDSPGMFAATAIAYLIYGFMLIPWVNKKKEIVEFPPTNTWT